MSDWGQLSGAQNCNWLTLCRSLNGKPRWRNWFGQLAGILVTVIWSYRNKRRQMETALTWTLSYHSRAEFAEDYPNFFSVLNGPAPSERRAPPVWIMKTKLICRQSICVIRLLRCNAIIEFVVESGDVHTMFPDYFPYSTVRMLLWHTS